MYLRHKRKSNKVSTRVSKWKLTSAGFLHWLARIKFFIGLLLIILSLILGKIALPAFALKANLSLLIYAISWVMAIVGIAMCGKRGWYIVKHLYRRYGNRVIGCFRKPKT